MCQCICISAFISQDMLAHVVALLTCIWKILGSEFKLGYQLLWVPFFMVLFLLSRKFPGEVTSSVLSNPLFLQSFEAVWSHLLTASLNRHKNRRTNNLLSFHYILSIWYDMDCSENTASCNSSVVACVFTAVGTCTPSHSLATARWSYKPAFYFLKMRQVD
jgi:hypothetical protein